MTMKLLYTAFFISVIGTLCIITLFLFIIDEKNSFFAKNNVTQVINLWMIFTRASSNGELVNNFRELVKSLCAHSSRTLHFNIISDKTSKTIANNILNKNISNCSTYHVSYYDKSESIRKIEDIVNVLTPHFSAYPGAYYSDPLFYLSLGLHRIAPNSQDKIILLDCDLIFQTDITLLFKEFNKFSSSNLFGLSHELSPVYYHALRTYRTQNIGTELGNILYGYNSYNKTGFPGFNSGVVLLNLSGLRKSSLYPYLLSNNTVMDLVETYSFRGSLGDQDYYTLLYFNYSSIFYILPCGWNRQLCKWWKNVKNNNIFDEYFKCATPTYVYHKNCHSSLSKI